MFMLFKSKKTKLIENFGQYIVRTSILTFKASIITFVVYFLLEQFKIGIISNYFDLNILIVLAIISGVFIVFFADETDYKECRSYKNYGFLMIFAILLGLLVFQQTRNLGNLSIIIALVSLIGIFTIFSLNLNKYD